MDTDDIDWEKLDRYVSGEGEPRERAEIERQLANDPELARIAAAMLLVGRPEAGPSGRDRDTEGAWHRLASAMRRSPQQALHVLRAPTNTISARHDRHRVRWRRVVIGAAAAVLVIAASTLAIRSAVAPSPAAHRAGNAEMREVATSPGQTAVVKLEDGSTITLSPGTRIRTQVGTARRVAGVPRDVYLEGEAYFDVKHDSANPLRVRTPIGVAEDIGTRFVVRAFPESRWMQVAVESGKVVLRRTPADRDSVSTDGHLDPPLILIPGDVARLDSTGRATRRRNVDVRPYLTWTQGGPEFDATLLSDAIPELERWYDVDIRLADRALGDRRITASFHNESSSQAIELLALSLNVKVQQRGRVVWLIPKAPNRAAP